MVTVEGRFRPHCERCRADFNDKAGGHEAALRAAEDWESAVKGLEVFTSAEFRVDALFRSPASEDSAGRVASQDLIPQTHQP